MPNIKTSNKASVFFVLHNIIRCENTPYHVITDFDTIVETAVEEKYINPEDKDRLLKFRANPSDESWIAKK